MRVPSGEIAGKMPSAIFSHPHHRDWLSRQPDLVQARFADRRKKLKQNSLIKRKQPRRARSDAPYQGLFFLWQYECGKERDGERRQEDNQIHESAKKELENAKEPALAVNVPNRQENLRDKRDP